jgi:ubiquinone/menaquinone biosynthesis C-methylase UbiE
MPSQLITRVQSGFADAMSYDAYRPSYPEESVRKLLEELKVLGSHKACILDLGAGTGKLTEQLVAQSEEYEIIAVDPHPEMLDVLVQKRLPRVRALEETASNLVEVGTGWVDAVVVGQVSTLDFNYIC